jgi:YggT family protein
MTTVGFALGAVLGLVQLVLLARLVLDWAVVLAGPPAHGSVRDRLTTVLYRITEPILAPVRRALPPLRLGGFALDLAFIVVFIGVSIVRSLVTRL